MTTNKTISVPVKLIDYLRKNAQSEYRRHHPEMKMIKLSDPKMLYEVLKFYCKNTPFELEDDDGL
jgi:phage terminase small subunit